MTGAKAKAGETEPDAENALKHLPMDHGIYMIYKNLDHVGILQMQAKGCREWGEGKGGRSGARREERIEAPANGPRHQHDLKSFRSC